MTFLEWSDGYLTGIDDIDNDHRHLFELVNSLHDRAAGDLGTEVIGDALEAFSTYVEQHFAREEAYMESYAYPDLLAHMHGHQKIKSQVRSFQTAYLENSGLIGTDTFLDFIRGWLTEHILKEDMAYVPYIKPEAR